jgi:Ser/Thr protein kinase RdoA (MazF antagonist)
MNGAMDAIPLGPRASLDAAALASIAATYDLGTVVDARDVGGTYNLNLRLHTERGMFVVRVYRPWITPQRLLATQHVRHVLARNDVPVAVPLATSDGTTLGTVHDRLFEVEPFIPHDAHADTWERYGVAFALLGRIHTILDQHLEHAALVPPLVSNYALPAQLNDWTEIVQRRIAAADPSPARTVALATCATTRALLSELISWWETHGQHLPQSVCHGDFGGGNVLLRDGAVAAVLDFDFVAVRERVFDLAYALYWMFVILEGQEPQFWSWHGVATMLAHYETTAAPLTDEERRALLWALVRVRLYWVGEAAFLPDPVQAIVAVAQDVQAMQWIHTHRGDLERILALT